MDPPTVTNSGTNVRIEWIAPNNNGAAITQYKIEILQNSLDGTSYYTQLTYCDGSTASIVTNRYCEIPTATLRALPFNLAYNTLI